MSDQEEAIRELGLQTRGLLAKMPEELRLVFHLIYGIDCARRHGYGEIAATLGVPEDAIRHAEARALRGMRNIRPGSFDFALEALRPIAPPAGLAEVIEKVERLTPELIAYLQENEIALDRVPWDVFEHLIAEFLAHQGFSDVALVGRDPSTSADIFAAWSVPSTGVSVRFFVEVKHWKGQVGIRVINEVLGAMIRERPRIGWHASMIVTSGGFSEFRQIGKPQLALQGVELKDRDDLLRWLADYRPNKHGLWLPAPLTVLPVDA